MAARKRKSSRRRTSRRSSRKRASKRRSTKRRSKRRSTKRRSTKRRTKRRRSSKKRRSTKKRAFRGKSTPGVTARRGYLSYGSFKAREYGGGNPAFKGRVEVRRDSGFVEYPAPEQIERIAKEEGVSRDHVETAFGHMKPLNKNAAARKKRFTVKRGAMYAPETPEREEVSLEAVSTPAGLEHRYGGRVKVIAVQVGGAPAQLLEPEQAAREARRLGFTQKQFERAFGHLVGGVGTGPGKEKGPASYGPRVMKLGYRDESGTLRPGVATGQLVLYNKRNGRVVWAAQAVAETAGTEDPQIRIAGRDVKWKTAFHRAQQRNIPELAFLEAFGFMLPEDIRRQLYKQFS